MPRSPRKNRQKLLSLTRKNFTWNYFSGSGGGGQKRNKCQNSVRLSHKPSGAKAVCQDFASKKQNERTAFKRIANTPKFKQWIKMECSMVVGDITRKLDEMMRPQNLKIETGVSFER